ncbi:MAG: hypothetical protein HW419_3863, partial [Deltaproteobacteria bacterium]|nr:hypothetical protein [Deltaproteobacteria bacterium]
MTLLNTETVDLRVLPDFDQAKAEDVLRWA